MGGTLVYFSVDGSDQCAALVLFGHQADVLWESISKMSRWNKVQLSVRGNRGSSILRTNASSMSQQLNHQMDIRFLHLFAQHISMHQPCWGSWGVGFEAAKLESSKPKFRGLERSLIFSEASNHRSDGLQPSSVLPPSSDSLCA